MTAKIKTIIYLILLRNIFCQNIVGTDLGHGIVTQFPVDAYADLALDIRDFRTALVDGDSQEAMKIYNDGKNAVLNNKGKLSWHGISVKLQQIKPESRTPIHNFQLYGLSDRETSESSLQKYAHYADNFVKSFVQSEPNLAADALVVLHTWMYATHILYHGIRTCQQLSNADNPDMFSIEGGGIDEFIALWIGSDQSVASSSGHSLYALTQRAGKMFNYTMEEQSEVSTNTKIKLLYQEGSNVLAIPDACSRDDDEGTVPALWLVVQRMVSQMYIPLFQLLIDAIMRGDTSSIQLYGKALIPQLSQCRPSVFKRLKEVLLDGTIPIRSDDVIADLQYSYDCLGLTCKDIGSYQGDQVPECPEIPIDRPLAEYVPTTHVHDHSKIDLDILQIGILSSISSNAYAHLLYLYGRNSPNYRENENDPYRVRSLMQMATTHARKMADPVYSEFVQYFNDQNYADTVVQDTLKRKGKWGFASAEQIHQVVLNTCAYQILYMNALAELADAVGACKKGDMLTGEGGAHQWDEVAAFLIGSLEGSGEGGSGDLEDGQLLWNLANRRAFQFQTESKSGFALINAELEDLLFAGRAEANSFACDNLQQSMDRIQNLILLPVIQSTIRDAILVQSLTSSSSNGDLASGETFALSVLPIVSRYDKNAGKIIKQNMVVVAGQPLVRDGPQAVANAFYQALDEFGYSCALVGATPQADACQLQGGLAKVKPAFERSDAFSITFSVSLMMCILLVATLTGG
jgi:Low iron-inducible periplasmic protein